MRNLHDLEAKIRNCDWEKHRSAVTSEIKRKDFDSMKHWSKISQEVNIVGVHERQILVTLFLLWKYDRSYWHSFDSSTPKRPLTEWLQIDAEPSVETGEIRTAECYVFFVWLNVQPSGYAGTKIYFWIQNKKLTKKCLYLK